MIFKCSLTRSKWGKCFKTCLSASQIWVMLGSENRMVINADGDTVKASELDTFGRYWVEALMLQGLMSGVTSRLFGVILTLLGPFCGEPF